MQTAPAITGHYINFQIFDIDLDNNEVVCETAHGSRERVPLWRIQPDDTVQFWELYVRRLIQKMRSEGVVPVEYADAVVTHGEDYTGDPALYVKLLFTPEQSPSMAKATERNQFSDTIRDRLLGALQLWKIQRWPHVRFGRVVEEEHAASR